MKLMDSMSSNYVIFTVPLNFILQRGDRQNVQNVVIVITDGQANNPSQARQESELLRSERGAYVFGIGVTNQIFESELQSYTSPPQQRGVTYWLTNSYGELAGIVDTFGTGICTYVAPTPGNG